MFIFVWDILKIFNIINFKNSTNYGIKIFKSNLIYKTN